MAEYIEREDAIRKAKMANHDTNCGYVDWEQDERTELYINEIPAADVRPVPKGGIGEMSDGYHTFNGLYYQRMVLFAALVKAHKDKAWKSRKHEDGELCFGGGWFIVGIDTPEGGYTYHYEEKDWGLFDCVELPVGRHWDCHTEKDVTRLLSLDGRPVVHAHWVHGAHGPYCSYCDAYPPISWRTNMTNETQFDYSRFCPTCGAVMDEDMREVDDED